MTEAVDAVLASGVCPSSGQTAAAVLAALEREARRLHAATIQAMHHIDAEAMHRVDGHPTVKVQAGHAARLSNGQALARSRTMRMLRALPRVKAAFWSGDIGVEQVQLLARVHANPRVAGAMELRQDRFVDQASRLPYRQFELKVREWERLIDEDGPQPANERTHRNRTAAMVQDPIELGWELRARYAAMQGAAIREIFDRYIDAEWRADWEKAVAERGNDACTADMPRTAAQRRADALWQIFQDAAGADGSAVPPGFCHNIVWSAETYEEMLRRFGGAEPTPLDPDTHSCRTLDGTPLEHHEAAANSLLNGFRGIVVNARGVTIHATGKRFFTGPLRTVVDVQSGGRCVWPGCDVPSTKCEADHLVEHGRGGPTNPANGAPLCGWHNRWKQKGFRLWRDPTGEWQLRRPDDTIVSEAQPARLRS